MSTYTPADVNHYGRLLEQAVDAANRTGDNTHVTAVFEQMRADGHLELAERFATETARLVGRRLPGAAG